MIHIFVSINKTDMKKFLQRDPMNIFYLLSFYAVGMIVMIGFMLLGEAIQAI